MVLKFPRLFGYSEKGSYAPLVEWFRSYLGMDTREVSAVASSFPMRKGELRRGKVLGVEVEWCRTFHRAIQIRQCRLASLRAYLRTRNEQRSSADSC